MTEQPSTDPLPLLSDHLAYHVAGIGAGIVAVHGRHGPPLSGFVWRRGAIVTAEEALEADEDITITVPDGRRIGATLAGRDPTTDVAVLQVADSEDLTHSRRVRAAISGQATWRSLSDAGPKA